MRQWPGSRPWQPGLDEAAGGWGRSGEVEQCSRLKQSNRRRSISAFRRMGALLIVGAMSLLLGACAHNAGNAPGVQWQFNSSDAGSAGPGDVRGR